MANQAALSDIITKPALPGAKGHIICLSNVQHWPVSPWCECVLHMKTTDNFGERLLSENVPASENGRAVDCLEVSDAAALNTKLAQENARLKRERDLLRMVIENLPDYIYAKDKQGHFVLNNHAHANDLGAKSPAEMKGKSDFDFFPQELAAQFFADEQKIIETVPQSIRSNTNAVPATSPAKNTGRSPARSSGATRAATFWELWASRATSMNSKWPRRRCAKARNSCRRCWTTFPTGFISKTLNPGFSS